MTDQKTIDRGVSILKSAVKSVNKSRILLEAGVEDAQTADPEDIVLSILIAGVRSIQRQGLVGVDDQATEELIDVLHLSHDHGISIDHLLERLSGDEEDTVTPKSKIMQPSDDTAILVSWDPTFYTAATTLRHTVSVPCTIRNDGLLLEAGHGDTIVDLSMIRYSVNTDGCIDEAFATSETNPGVKVALSHAVNTGILSKMPDWKYATVEWNWGPMGSRMTLQEFLKRYGVHHLVDANGNDVTASHLIDLKAVSSPLPGVAELDEIEE
jgi:hypothetical protein